MHCIFQLQEFLQSYCGDNQKSSLFSYDCFSAQNTKSCRLEKEKGCSCYFYTPFVTWKISLAVREVKNGFRSSHQRFSIKKGVLKTFAKITGIITCARVSFFNEFEEILAQVFFCEFYEIFKSTFLQNSCGRKLLLITVI